jgi:hypothetical protein
MKTYPDVEYVRCGFLDWNLLQDDAGIDVSASANSYAEILREKLHDVFPNAEIDVCHQDASGSKPASLSTLVFVSGEDFNNDELSEVADDVAADVWDNHNWIVEGGA